MDTTGKTVVTGTARSPGHAATVTVPSDWRNGCVSVEDHSWNDSNKMHVHPLRRDANRWMDQPSSKHQKPSSRVEPTPKPQTQTRGPRARRFRTWCLRLLGCLVPGVWCLDLVAVDQPQWGQAW